LLLSLDSYSVVVVDEDDDDAFSRSVSDCFVRFFSSYSSRRRVLRLCFRSSSSHRLKRDRPLRERYERKRERRRDVTKRDERVKDDLTDGVKRAFLVHGNDIFEEFFSFGSKIT